MCNSLLRGFVMLTVFMSASERRLMQATTSLKSKVITLAWILDANSSMIGKYSLRSR